MSSLLTGHRRRFTIEGGSSENSVRSSFETARGFAHLGMLAVRRLFVAIAVLFPAAAAPSQVPVPAAEREEPVDEIKGLWSLGLPNDLGARFSRNETVCVLVPPQWGDVAWTRMALTRHVFRLPGETADDSSIQPLDPRQANDLIVADDIPSIRNDLRVVAESFVQAVFGQKLPDFEYTLDELVQDTKFESAPLVIFDPSFRVKVDGENEWLETWLAVRIFHLEVEALPEVDGKSERVVTRCELLFEDRALGRALLKNGASQQRRIDRVLRASMIDALRGKIVVSLVLDGLMKDVLTVRRPSLLGESLGRQKIQGGK